MQKLIFGFVLLIGLLSPLSAAPKPSVKTPHLKVGVLDLKPFAWWNGQNPQGFSVDVWKKTADSLGLRYTFTSCSDNVDLLLQEVRQGKIDVIVGPIAPMQKFSRHMHLSSPYFVDEIVALTHEQDLKLKDVLAALLQSHIISLFLVGLFVCAIGAWIHWILTGKKISFKKAYYYVLIRTFGHLVVFKQTANDKVKILNAAWLIFSLTFISLFIGTLSSHIAKLLNSRPTEEVFKGHQVKAFGGKIGLIEGIVSENSLAKLSLRREHLNTFSNLHDMLKSFQEHKLDMVLVNAVAYDAYAETLSQRTHYRKIRLGNTYFTFAFAKNHSNLVHNFNHHLNALNETGQISLSCRVYFTDRDRFCAMFLP